MKFKRCKRCGISIATYRKLFCSGCSDITREEAQRRENAKRTAARRLAKTREAKCPT